MLAFKEDEAQMLESLRNFLSGKRVIVITALLAIPFVFLGSQSFGTTFASFGTVNGEPVSQMDVNLATSQVSQRLRSMYGEDFSLDDLDEEVSLGLIKNEIINQKTLLSHARKLGLIVSEKAAKQEIINIESFQGENGFDQTLFESTIRANGWTPEEYIELVRETMSLDTLVSAMGITAFPINRDVEALASMLETSRDIDFIKVDKNILVNEQEASLEEGQVFYENNPFLFLSKEQRDFSYIVLTYDAYKKQVQVPEGYIDEAYSDYLSNVEGQIQNKISHLMIEKSNYESPSLAFEKVNSIYESIQAKEISFEDAVSNYSEDDASKDSGGDLGLSSGDAFPEEFENAILTMQLNSISPIIELEDSLHILKLTEVIKPQIKTKTEISDELLSELIDAEALALMQDDFLELESMVLEGVTLNALANAIDAPVQVTGLKDFESIALDGFSDIASSELFNSSVLPNKIEIFEGDESYAFVMMTQALQPTVQPFVDVADLAIQEVRDEKANMIINDFAIDAEGILNGESTLPSQNGFTQESYKGVKRFSSLLPSEIINSTFESPTGTLVSSEAFNGDRYWAKSSNESTPTIDELGESIEQYQGFYNESLSQQFSGFIDRAFKAGQKVRLENLTSN
ncbi:SurA N-terminal domain-containing protein [Gammaproteobacteria bacterium]|nr:SurA N-terminal domain-containing protein [Gammaproteobacteria bacterium]MDC0387350.1 SurA N-terminal domain-containing protein [Gammaproteobacteria bacterium]